MASQKFLIIDGSSLAYRAFFALPLLQNRRGEHTNAVYGFTTMLLRLLESESPVYGAVIFDCSAPTFRHDIYRDYKAHREKTPGELGEQISRIKEILAAFGLPFFEQEGYEADDLIGSLARKSEGEGANPLLVTGDTDLFQLITPSTRVLLVRKGITETDEYDLDRLYQRYGLAPGQMVDFRALKGDPSDNIPGVPGIGEKTALKLLHEYGSLEQVLGSSGKMKGKLKENLELYRDQALLSRELSVIRCDLKLPFSLEDCRIIAPDYNLLSEIFEELQFRSLREKLSMVSPRVEVVGGRDERTTAIASTDQLEEVKRQLTGRPVALLVELEPAYPRWKASPSAMAIALDESGGYYFSPSVLSSGQWENFWKELCGKSGQPVRFLGHDVKLVNNFFYHHRLPEPEAIFDSMLSAYLLDPGSPDFSRQRILKDTLGVDLPLEPSMGKKADPPDKEKLSSILAAQARHYFKLHQSMKEKMKEQDLDALFYNMEMPLTMVLSGMERLGIRVDCGRLAALSGEIRERVALLREEIFCMAGEEFNLNSPRQLACVLFEKLKLPAGRRTKTGFSTDVKVLEDLAARHEIVASILRYRQLIKLEGTYLSGLLPLVDRKTGRLYTTFNQMVTATGRLSSSDPNLQNIPVRLEEGRRVREAFLPSREGFILMSADYSQIELRILAHISGDTTLIESFNRGEDIHRRTASEVFDVPLDQVTSSMRDSAKAVNFGIIYGISDYGLGQGLKISRKEAQLYIDKYFERYRGVKNYMDGIVKKARESGYVTTLCHRRRYLPDITSANFSRRSFAERTARNTPIQGSAADIIKLAMLGIDRRLAEGGHAARLLLQVHDELILELPAEEREEVAALVREEMEGAYSMDVPVKVDLYCGNDWYSLK